MATINGRACVVDGHPVDKVFSNGKIVYGRNLLMITSNKTQNHTIGKNLWANATSSLMAVTAGQVFTYCLYVDPNNTEELRASVDGYHGGSWKYTWTGNSIKAGDGGYSYLTITVPDGITQIRTTGTRLPQKQPNNTVDVYWKEEKLELGTTATPWSPAPEDVM
jgi:hypothetical protein